MSPTFNFTHARRLTKERRLLLGMEKMQRVGVIDSIEEISIVGVADNSGSGNIIWKRFHKKIG